MKMFAGCIVAALAVSQAAAEPGTINLTTNKIKYSKWTVHEITNGKVVSGAPVFLNPHGQFTWGNLPSITIPSTNCDGYWYAERTFKIPKSATNLTLKITRIGADDRIVVTLNDAAILSEKAS